MHLIFVWSNYLCQNPRFYSSKSLLGFENDKPKEEHEGGSFTVSYLFLDSSISLEEGLDWKFQALFLFISIEIWF
ncbi:hypothetical protein RchiOBHm_Chr5g0079751 [Rosa chinensis]|uniref:Uncharacterized protein n=1 Tax=Rosa chinensis TaxID=74649 RepID=A0A2P6QMK4_ROSCH|nr:hypothetical protein RchiOBHm_Chr5g0079751 [Rosa chinensis]